MIVKKKTIINGRACVIRYSDKGVKLMRDGELYDEAIDLESMNREYCETNIPRDTEEAEDA